MSSIMKLIAASLLGLLCIGCSSAQKDFIPLQDATKAQIGSSDFSLLHVQDEINVDVEESNISRHTGGGLLIAMIDASITNSRTKDAEKLVSPIRAELTDFDIDEEVKNKVLPIVKDTSWLRMKSFKLVQGMGNTARDDILKNAKSDVVGMVNTAYSLTSDFSAINVSLTLELYPISHGVKQFSKSKKNNSIPIYRTKVVCSKRMMTATKNAEKNAKLWVANNGQQIKSTMRESIDYLSAQLNNELQHPDRHG